MTSIAAPCRGCGCIDYVVVTQVPAQVGTMWLCRCAKCQDKRSMGTSRDDAIELWNASQRRDQDDRTWQGKPRSAVGRREGG